MRVTTANAGWAGTPAKAAWQRCQKPLQYGSKRLAWEERSGEDVGARWCGRPYGSMGKGEGGEGSTGTFGGS